MRRRQSQWWPNTGKRSTLRERSCLQRRHDNMRKHPKKWLIHTKNGHICFLRIFQTMILGIHVSFQVGKLDFTMWLKFKKLRLSTDLPRFQQVQWGAMCYVAFIRGVYMGWHWHGREGLMYLIPLAVFFFEQTTNCNPLNFDHLLIKKTAHDFSRSFQWIPSSLNPHVT